MAKNTSPTDILKEIAAETEKAATQPDFVDIDGVRYYKDSALAAANNRRKAEWRNPRRPLDPPQNIEVEQVAINLAPYAAEIRLDGVIYLAGRVYDFPLPVAASVREIISRTWQHEASTGGAYSHGTASGVRGSQSQSGVLAGGGVRFA